MEPTGTRVERAVGERRLGDEYRRTDPEYQRGSEGIESTLKDSPQNNEGLHVQNVAANLGMNVADVRKAGDELLSHSTIRGRYSNFEMILSSAVKCGRLLISRTSQVNTYYTLLEQNHFHLPIGQASL